MSDFENVTFGGSGLDRAAELRGDADAMAQALSDDTSRSLVFWRGKPLTRLGDEAHLLRLPMDHEMLKRAIDAPVFLGREDTGFVFATDISSWEPAAQDMPEAVFLDQTEQHFPGLPQDHLFVELRTIMTRLSARDAELAAMAKSLFSWHAIHGFCAKCGAKSNVMQAGWQRVCGSCNAMHFPRTDPVVIMLITHGNKVLLGRSPYWPEGMYSLLAGFLEPGETPEAAVRREVYEEAGVRVGSVRYLGSQPWAFPSSLMLGFSGEALGTDITLEPVELEDAIWVSREEMMQIFEGTHPKMRRPRSGAIAHYILKNWLEDCLE
ncbi:NAD(+) diphosphatase [Cognatishimia maritima]|uniref:NAD(+) diphosphatase n=1 Tax=Cognatishimia maritima TaxID=870908 RepID=A0A1M5RIM1_9RHOB|nr:NAD(+) diphosphatase [Cognatishimia maritima]SHH26182.1 NAD+ diphosphatase [Cognatishimia maritima]